MDINFEKPVIREFNWEVDSAALQNLDTSFTTEFVYEVTAQNHVLTLDYSQHIPFLKKIFSIDLDQCSKEYRLIAIADSHICGFIAATFEVWNKRLNIQHFYVDRVSRGKGIGKMLFGSVLSYGQSVGAEIVWTETSNLNYPGIEIYKKLGFSVCGFDLSLYQGTAHKDEFAVFLSLPLALH